MSSRRPDPSDLDFDAEQEVDFGRIWSTLASHWWLPLLGLVVGAILGYIASLGGSQVYKAQTTLYLGQPYSVSGNVQLQSAQTNPSTVRQIVNAQSTLEAVAPKAKLKASDLRGKIAVAPVSGNLAKLGQTPLVTITVQGSARRKIAAAANALADEVVANPVVAGYANAKIRNFRAEISADELTVAAIEKAARSGAVSPTDQLVAQIQLRTAQQDRIQATGLLQQAQLVEAPRVVTKASASKVTARSRRNSVVVAAIIGLIVGILAALAWDAVAARVRRS
jgi:capsular polysaccharide biosynthesis protein